MGYCFTGAARNAAAILVMLLAMGASNVSTAQTYSCFPSCDATDGRLLALAGAGVSTMSGDTIYFGFAMPAGSDSLEIGIFDGETGGMWDGGTTPLEYTLYADPYADGLGTTVIGSWSGSIMPDNAWYRMKVKNPSSAMAPGGNYFYKLRVRLTSVTSSAASAFKVRVVGGTLTLYAKQSLDIIAPLSNLQTAQVIYPNYPGLGSTTYDGSWKIYLDVPVKVTALSLWDGDMDYGSYNGAIKDSDDVDTQNGIMPVWARGTEATNEGMALGTPATDTLNRSIGGRSSGAPADDERRALFRRSPAIKYSITSPHGVVYQNNNPSGNLEWEQFRIGTGVFSRSKMDYRADSLPGGIYTIDITGMDLGNLNSWRFFQDITAPTTDGELVIGVDSVGGPVSPLRPFKIAGSVIYDANSSGGIDTNDSPMDSVAVRLNIDRNYDGVVDRSYTTTTDADGHYNFPNLPAGDVTVMLDTTTVTSGCRTTFDVDGISTRNRAGLRLAQGRNLNDSILTNLSFGYSISDCSGPYDADHWTSSSTVWPVRQLRMGCSTYTKAQLLTILGSSSNDKTYELAKELIVAKLNVAICSEHTCVVDNIIAADLWLCINSLGSNPGNVTWNLGGKALERALGRFNDRGCDDDDDDDEEGDLE